MDGHMVSKVFLTDLRTRPGLTILDKVDRLFDATGAGQAVPPGARAAVKIHWGEGDNLAFIPPPFIGRIVDRVREAGGRPFLTDTNTLYRGTRRDAIDHVATALSHGFGPEAVRAPIIIADGLAGENYATLPAVGKHFSSLRIAGAIHRADSLVVVSHVKGHLLFGFGGAIKNLGMGCSDPAGKQQMHADVRPKVKTKKCTGCGSCVEVCPAGAASLPPSGSPERDPVAHIDLSECIGCAQCVTTCPVEAIPIQWGRSAELVQEKAAEYALGVYGPKRGRCAFFNFLINITPDCDCLDHNDVPIVADIGILAADDPVAIDQASMDLINSAPPLPGTRLPEGEIGDKFTAIHGHSWEPGMEYGEAIGLGSRKYELIKVD